MDKKGDRFWWHVDSHVANHYNSNGSMGSKSLWWWCISTKSMLLYIIHHPVFIQEHHPVYITKHNVSETGFCLHLQKYCSVIQTGWYF
jgi:hypothetical protein